MNYSQYPPTSSPFYEKKNEINIFKADKSKNCFITQGMEKDCKPNVEYGFHKPLNESCPLITGQLNNGPEKNCSSLWNNMTRRKSLVKDY